MTAKKSGVLELYARAVIPRDPFRVVGSAPAGDTQSRAPRGTLSREQIVSAAISVIEDGEYESMTIRSLASRSSVLPP